ncbi:uncharacterized protein LOC129281362 isoform X1 [Lytechinus pictus]|uniref:uncharacterized protein LOC129281362 isoform X1 n=1 Tax=Lytechinus pictus TaxID=7653 RepID=UPI0030B9DFF5
MMNRDIDDIVDSQESTHCPSATATEQIKKNGQEERSVKDPVLPDISNDELVSSAITCSSFDQEKGIGIGIDDQEREPCAPGNTNFMEEEAFQKEPSGCRNDDITTGSDETCKEAFGTMNQPSLTQNTHPGILTGQSPGKSQTDSMDVCFQIDFDPDALSQDLSIEANGSESEMNADNSQSMVALSDQGECIDKIADPECKDGSDKTSGHISINLSDGFKDTSIVTKSPKFEFVYGLQEDDVQVPVDTSRRPNNAIAIENTTELDQKSPCPKACRDLDDEGKPEKSDVCPDFSSADNADDACENHVNDDVSVNVATDVVQTSLIPEMHAEDRGSVIKDGAHHCFTPPLIAVGQVSCGADSHSSNNGEELARKDVKCDNGFVKSSPVIQESSCHYVDAAQVSLCEVNSDRSEIPKEYKVEAHIHNAETAHPDHELDYQVLYYSDLVLKGMNSQQSSVTSMDTLDFSQDTQRNTDPALYCQDIDKIPFSQGGTDPSALPFQNVDAVVPDCEITKTQSHYESQNGGCPMTEHSPQREVSSCFDPTSIQELYESEQSVPEISISVDHETSILQEDEGYEQVNMAGKVSQGDHLPRECTTPEPEIELPAHAFDCVGKEVYDNRDGFGNARSMVDYQWVITPNNEPFLLQTPECSSEDLICDRSNMPVYDNNQLFRDSSEIPFTVSPNVSQGRTPLEHAERSSWNASHVGRRTQPQLWSTASVSSPRSKQEAVSPVFELPHPEQLCNYASKQADHGTSPKTRLQDDHLFSPTSTILPHPSYLKTSVKRNATNKDPKVCKENGSSKDGIYWKKFVSSGKVRRNPQTPTNSMYLPRQESYDFQEILPLGTERMFPCSTPVVNDARAPGPFGPLAKGYPEIPTQTEFEPRQEWSNLEMHSDTIEVSSIPATAPFGSLLLPPQSSSIKPTVEDYATSPVATERLSSSQAFMRNIQQLHRTPDRNSLQCGQSDDDRDLGIWETTSVSHANPCVLPDYCDPQPRHNSNLFNSDTPLQGVHNMPHAVKSSPHHPPLSNDHQLWDDFFGVSRSQIGLPQATQNCRNQQVPQSRKAIRHLSINRIRDEESLEQDVFCLYPTVRAPSQDVLLEEERYIDNSSYQKEAHFHVGNVQTYGEDVMSPELDLQLDSPSSDNVMVAFGSQHLGMSFGSSARHTSRGDIGIDGPLEAIDRHHKSSTNTCPAIEHVVYGNEGKVVDAASSSSAKVSIKVDGGWHFDGPTKQVQVNDDIQSSILHGNLEQQVDLTAFKAPQGSDSTYIDEQGIHQYFNVGVLEKLQSDLPPSPAARCEQYLGGNNDSNRMRHSGIVIDFERSQTPDLFTTQNDDPIDDCNPPEESLSSNIIIPADSLTLLDNPFSLECPGKQMDATDQISDAMVKELQNTSEQETLAEYNASRFLSQTPQASGRKMAWKRRPLISKPTNVPNTPLPKIFSREAVEDITLPLDTESQRIDTMQAENYPVCSIVTDALHEVCDTLKDHFDGHFPERDMSGMNQQDEDIGKMFSGASADEAPSLLQEQQEFTQECNQERHPRSASLNGGTSKGINGGECSLSNMDQLHQEEFEGFHELPRMIPTGTCTRVPHKHKEVMSYQHYGEDRELALVLDMVHIENKPGQSKLDVLEKRPNDWITDDLLCNSLHGNRASTPKQRSDEINRFLQLTEDSLQSSGNIAQSREHYEPSNEFRVGTPQNSLEVGQLDVQVNRRQHKPSLHHLHHANLNGDRNEMGKSGSQTQSGDVFPGGVDGRGRKKGFRTPVSMMSNIGMRGELNFPSADTVHSGSVPQRKITIPVSFPSGSSYKQVLTEAVKEHLNILLYELSHRYHSTMEKADITPYTKTHHSGDAHLGTSGGGGMGNPPCKHGQPAKMVCVKKDGPNKGRMFYVCNNQRENQCKFFEWADQHSAQASQTPTQPSQSRAKISLHNAESIEKFARTNQIHLYCECQLSRRGSLNEGPLGSAPSWIKKYRAQQLNNTTKKLYIKLDRKEHSSTYAKDDLWIVSQDLTFDPACSFVAKSRFHGPSSTSEIEIEPLTGYSPSNWSRVGAVYGILACNASSELTCLENLQEYVNPRTFPILSHLISCEPEKNPSFHGPAFVKPARSRHLNLPSSLITELVEDTIRLHHLNPDQSLALQQVSSMLGDDDPPVTLIHGVFGAGKSYLLAVMVLFLINLFKLHEENEPTGQDGGWKVLIASTTNVAVDRILLGLLELGFEDFIRVGSLRKIAKPVLPYSVHASDKENQEMKELQEMLKGDLTQSEKQLVRRSIERQRLGKNKEMLSKVKVIGVTCAACSFPCIKNLKFPVVLLDECSQMTEPSSLLPMARFGCEKLVLVGDPHQLDPTIQGSESAHKSGLEQTLFDRLSLMGYDPIMLRTQYRCHPCISSIANTLFYDGQLLDGVIEEDRPPLLPNLPTLCFFNISHGREMSSRDGSYFNDPEASFVVFLISSMMEMGISPSDVGVITLYKAQVSRIRMLLQTLSTQKSSELKAIQISTVDAFQGGEKSIIILSCVRTQRVGFIDSDKRTNVALTRSKNHLLIVGGMKMLSDNHLWGEIIHKCQEHPGGIQDSKGFQKKWEERLKELKQDVDPEPEKRPRRTRGKRRKLERNEREHSPAMSLDSDDNDDFVSSVSLTLPGTIKGLNPDTSGVDCSKNTIPLPPGSPHSTLSDNDLVCVDLSTPPEDMELSNTRSRPDLKESAPVPDATFVASHLALEVGHPLCHSHSFPVDDDLSSIDLVTPPDPQLNTTTRLKMDYAESEEDVSSAVPGTCPGDNLTCTPRSSTEEDDLPSIDIGTRSMNKDIGNSKRSIEHKNSFFLGDGATVEECRDSVVQESVKTPEASFSYSPLEHVVESDSEESGEDIPNFDIGDIFS